ncbi:MAG: hypothetical protein QF596_09580 [Acidimicrobiales bacterium]|nr:hypothetical protein [Acidimicrobiales bacterium]MDP6299641.1 hypothetical protein [Acidimicrobiales bacterium]HJM28797.1 hypothetical protein [Acidimicrobiales bacterium]HJM98173.1 hypothetical protein [Acidimicrobiales bacterium]
MIVSEEEMLDLRGYKFPGGVRTVEHWENWLLTDCTTGQQLPDNLVHPIALFHVPIQGSGCSISELFSLVRVQGAGSVGLDGYDWEYFHPLKEDVPYLCEGEVIDVQRVKTDNGKIYDRFVFSIDLLNESDLLIARVTNHWRLWRKR